MLRVRVIRSENPIRPSDGVLENIYGRGVRFAAEELPIPFPESQSPLVIASKRTLRDGHYVIQEVLGLAKLVEDQKTLRDV